MDPAVPEIKDIIRTSTLTPTDLFTMNRLFNSMQCKENGFLDVVCDCSA